MKRDDSKERFEVIRDKSIFNSDINTIIVDRETGIEYLYHQNGDSGGLTVLLDRDGKPKLHQDSV